MGFFLLGGLNLNWGGGTSYDSQLAGLRHWKRL